MNFMSSLMYYLYLFYSKNKFFIHKCLFHSNSVPSTCMFANYFTRRNYVHQYNTRRNTDLNVPLAHSKPGERSILIVGSKLWNCLPSELKVYSSINVFKNDIKNLLLSITKLNKKTLLNKLS